jgi:hypothetical protein
MNIVGTMLSSSQDSFSGESCAFERTLFRDVLNVSTRFDTVMRCGRKQVLS